MAPLAALAVALGTSATAGAVGAALAVAARGRLLALAGGAAAETALADGVALVLLTLGAAVAAWYAVTGLLVAVCVGGRLVGRAWQGGDRLVRRRGAPLLRRLVAVTAGAALSGALAVSTTAAADVPDDLRWAPRPAATAAAEPAPAPAATAEPSPQAPSVHVVVAGESLWRIAEQHLAARGDPTHPAAVATAWPAWYAANRDVVGPDPDLIHPGQVLTPPGASA